MPHAWPPTSRAARRAPAEIGGSTRVLGLLGALPTPRPTPDLDERILLAAFEDRRRRGASHSWLSDLRTQVLRGAMRTTGTLIVTILTVALLGAAFVFAASQFVAQFPPFIAHVTATPVATPTLIPVTAAPTVAPATNTATPGPTSAPSKSPAPSAEPSSSPSPSAEPSASASTLAEPGAIDEPEPIGRANTNANSPPSPSVEPSPSATAEPTPTPTPTPSPTDKRRTPPPSQTPSP